MAEHPSSSLSLDNLIYGAILIELTPAKFHKNFRELSDEYEELHEQLLSTLYTKYGKEQPEKLRKAILSSNKETLDDLVEALRIGNEDS